MQERQKKLLMRKRKMPVIKFAKMHPDATFPEKDKENGGYDIYPAFDGEFMIILPGETIMIPTGICSAFPDDYVIVLKERGSTGIIGLGQRAGVIDSGYRGEWFVPLTNHNTDGTVIFISKIPSEKIKESYGDMSDTIVYPYNKAIAQALILPVPKVKIKRCDVDEIKAIPSKRGTGALGSTGK